MAGAEPNENPMPQAHAGVVMFPWPDGSVWRRWLIGAALLAVVAYLVYAVREIWVPLGLAFLLATILDPVVDRMEARGWKRGTATFFIFGSFIFIVLGLIWLATPYAVAQGVELQKKFNEQFPDMSRRGLLQSFHAMKAPDWLSNVGVQVLQGSQSAVERSSNWVTTYGVSVLSNMIWLAIVPVVAFYALRDYHLILAKSLLLVPHRQRDKVQTYVVEVGAIFAKYLRGLAIVSLLNGTATWLLLAALGIPGSLVLGIVAGLLYSVPYIGALITIVLTAAVSFSAGHLSGMLVAVGLSFILHQIVFDQIITPRILGGHVGLHPILAIIALLVGNILLGIVGMILAVPVAACIQIGVLAAVPRLRIDIPMPEPTVDVASAVIADIDEANKGEEVILDATQDLHQGVKEAVDLVEEQAIEAQIAEAALLPEPEQTTGDV